MALAIRQRMLGDLNILKRPNRTDPAMKNWHEQTINAINNQFNF